MGQHLIIGGGGMVGQKLAHALAASPLHFGDTVTLFDLGFPEDGAPADKRVTGNAGDTALIQSLVAERPETIFHLAAIVSGQAATEFDLGWQVNMAAFQTFLEKQSLRFVRGPVYVAQRPNNRSIERRNNNKKTNRLRSYA